ncbi:MAG TPA: hypothetical protein ENF16_06375 [Bacteroidetes bacterium]|nr:hypothetical protein [Bacteroidota bacterium]
MEKQPALVGWLKLLIGLTALVGVVWFFSTGYTPPGIFGEVIRHNQAHQIDASPFFYGDVENMTELEEGLKEIIANNKNSR